MNSSFVLVNPGEDGAGVIADRVWGLATKLSSQVFSSGGNIAFSPASVFGSLCLLKVGSAGPTLNELKRLVGDVGAEDLAYFDGALGLGQSGRSESCETKTALGLWLDDRTKPTGRFLDECESAGIDPHISSFSDGRVPEEIADWVYHETEGLIRPEITLGKDAAICLASALYAKGEWETEFVRLEGFLPFGYDDKVVQGAFMDNTYTARVLDGDGGLAVRVDTDDGFGLIVALPDGRLEAASGKAVLALLRRCATGDGDMQLVHLVLPKFSCESDIDVREAVRDAGLASIDEASLFPMTGLLEASFVDISHGARVLVDERGIEAAAYTFAFGKCGGLDFDVEPETPREIKIDRPFAFAFVSPTGAPLFVGAVREPETMSCDWQLIWELYDEDGICDVGGIDWAEEIPGVCKAFRGVKLGSEDTGRVVACVEGYGARERFVARGQGSRNEAFGEVQSFLKGYAARLDVKGFDRKAYLDDYFAEGWSVIDEGSVFGMPDRIGDAERIQALFPDPILDDAEERALATLTERYEKLVAPGPIGKLATRMGGLLPSSFKEAAGNAKDAITEQRLYEQAMGVIATGFKQVEEQAARFSASEKAVVRRANKILGDDSIHRVGELFLLRYCDVVRASANDRTVNLMAAFVEGAATGAPGFAGIPFNLVLSTFLYFRAVQSVAMSHGFDVKNDPAEMEIAGQVLANALSPRSIDGGSGLAAQVGKVMMICEAAAVKQTVGKGWAAMAERGGAALAIAQMRALANKAAENALKKAGKRGLESSVFRSVFEQVGRKLTQNVVRRAVPVVSGLLGAFFDAGQMSQIVEYANIFYGKRFILEKETRVYGLLGDGEDARIR